MYEVLRQVTTYAKDRAYKAGMDINFVLKTNGTLLEKEMETFLRREEVKVIISIDGKQATHDKYRIAGDGKGTHRTVAENLKRLMSRGISPIASTTVHPNEAGTLLESVRYLHQSGCNIIEVGPAYGTVAWHEESISAFVESLHDVAVYMSDSRREGQYLEVGPLYLESQHVGAVLKNTWGCGAGMTQLAFLPDGRITGCSALAMLVTSFPKLIIGNIRDGINNLAAQRLVYEAQANVDKRAACRKCLAAADCTGGCLAINYAVNKAPLKPPRFYCRIMRSISNAWEIAWKDCARGYNDKC